MLKTLRTDELKTAACGVDGVEAGGGSKVDLDLMTWSLGSTRHGATA